MRPFLVTLSVCLACWLVGTYWVTAGVLAAFFAGVCCAERGWLDKRQLTEEDA